MIRSMNCTIAINMLYGVCLVMLMLLDELGEDDASLMMRGDERRRMFQCFHGSAIIDVTPSAALRRVSEDQLISRSADSPRSRSFLPTGRRVIAGRSRVLPPDGAVIELSLCRYRSAGKRQQFTRETLSIINENEGSVDSGDDGGSISVN